MRVIIAGGRDFNDYRTLSAYCDLVLSYIPHEEIEIVSGTARGADRLGERYAKERGYALKRIPANWDLHKKAAGWLRNKEMSLYSQALIAFWDGESKGTGHMIEIAENDGLDVRIHIYKKD